MVMIVVNVSNCATCLVFLLVIYGIPIDIVRVIVLFTSKCEHVVSILSILCTIFIGVYCVPYSLVYIKILVVEVDAVLYSKTVPNILQHKCLTKTISTIQLVQVSITYASCLPNTLK